MADTERYPYEIESRWRVPGEIGDVYATLTDSEALPRWWPEAYSTVRVVAKGDEQGVGRITDITTRGVLPYEVVWRVTITETRPPKLIRLAASGDVIGRGEWRLRPDGGDVLLTYLWRVRVARAWMQRFEFLLRPIFVANHKWVMRRGELGLRAELARRDRSPIG